ncbi:MAG: PD-(D/E)XK nuclease family protein [Bdellovibrionales bacterium]|nr:PD-(D/E)XK nuclease family protein [Bdellovibrionales bacterium]
MARVYVPGSVKPYRLSRSQIEEYINCPKCFYLNRRVGVPKLPSFPFSLNSAVDSLLKNEFDIYREKQLPHPMMIEHKIEAVPFKHEDMETWRSNFKGIEYFDKDKNLIICGAVDDLWVKPNGELIVVDYKSTAKKDEVTIDADWQGGYRRQMEVYQWILRKMGYQVDNTGYFVYANGISDKPSFDNTLHFRTSLLPYTGDDSWVEEAVGECFEVLNGDEIPSSGDECGVCEHREAVFNVLESNFL